VRLLISYVLIVLGAIVGCGDTNGGTGGNGGDPLTAQSSYRLTCTINEVVLEIPIDLSFELDRPYTEGGSADLTFSAVVTFEEPAIAMLLDAGISTIDIITAAIGSRIDGATPQIVESSLSAPINNFDLALDTDDNGIAGPRRLPLDAVTTTTMVTEGANEVTLATGTDQVSLLLGDFHVPTGCLGPTLVGFSARFPVEPVE